VRFRLRGIDTPELNTLAGINARAFVRDALSQVSFVVLSTYRTDTYGRYLADLRYLPGETDPVIVRDRAVSGALLPKLPASRVRRASRKIAWCQGAASDTGATPASRLQRLSWAAHLARVFSLNALVCPDGGGRMRLSARER